MTAKLYALKARIAALETHVTLAELKAADEDYMAELRQMSPPALKQRLDEAIKWKMVAKANAGKMKPGMARDKMMTQMEATDKKVRMMETVMREKETKAAEIKGGAGSGNWGHAGRPGKRGGSSSRGGGRGSASQSAAPKAMYSFAPGSAGERYEKNRQTIVSNVERMEGALAQFEKEQKQDKLDWGYAGSLAGLASHLNDYGINVSDPPLAKTADEQFKNRAAQVKKQLRILKKIKPADRNTDWSHVGDVAHLAEVSRDAMTYLIDEDTL